MTGADLKKLDELVNTAVLIEQTQHDETIMVKVLREAEEMIEQGKYAEAHQILTDGSTYEIWMEKFGAQIRTGIAYCLLMKD